MPTWALLYLESIAAAEMPAPLAVLTLAIMAAGAGAAIVRSILEGN